MTVPSALRSLEIDLPACPEILVKLSLLLHDDNANVQAIGQLIERDMALGAAVVRTVNSALFGLLRRVESVPEAVRYLGMREVTALTFEIGLRGAFPPSPLLTALWDRAGKRGLVMARSARALSIDPWLAHTAGLFAESGQAALMAHDADGYPALLEGTPDALSQLAAETAVYGVQHAALGAALCQSWGLAADVAAAVRLRPAALRRLAGDDGPAWQAEPEAVQRLLALGAAVDAALETDEAQAVQHCCERLAPLAGTSGTELREIVAGSIATLGH